MKDGYTLFERFLFKKPRKTQEEIARADYWSRIDKMMKEIRENEKKIKENEKKLGLHYL